MKKILTAVAIIITTAAHSQFYLAPYAGISTGTPVAGLKAGYQYSNFLAEAEIKYHPDRYSPAYFGGNAGINIPIGSLTITPLLGAYYRLQSTDQKWKNYTVLNYALRTEYKSTFIEISRTDKTTFFTIGFRGMLKQQQSITKKS